MHKLIAEWKTQFDVPEEELALHTGIYPEVVYQEVDKENMPALSPEDFVESYVSAPIAASTAEAFSHYLDIGEFSAARKLLSLGFAQEKFDFQLRDSKYKWQQKYDHLHSTANSLFQECDTKIISRKKLNEWESVKRPLIKNLWHTERVGVACQLLEEAIAIFQQGLDKEKAAIEKDVQSFRAAIDSLVIDEIAKNQFARIVSHIDNLLKQSEIQLARNVTEKIRQALESSNADLLVSGLLETSLQEETENDNKKRSFIDPGQFPQIPVKDIVVWFNDSLSTKLDMSRPEWKDFEEKWAMQSLRNTKIRQDELEQDIEDEDSNRSVAKALILFDRCVSGRQKKDWRYFFRHFLRALGLNANAVQSKVGFPPIPNSTDLLYTYWGEREGTEISVPATFLNRRLFPVGIPIIIWGKNPRDYTPQQALSALSQKGLESSVGLIFTPFQVLPQTRLEFHRHLPNWAILDERVILKILFAPRSEERCWRLTVEMAQQIRPESITPYATQGPIEHKYMFFGRAKEIDQLLNPHGPAIIYGGRQLGKSSLLKQVALRFQQRDEMNNFAVYVSESAAGLTPGSAIELLNRMRAELVSRKPEFGKYIDVNAPAEVFLSQLSTLPQKFPRVRLLFLLDEADSFCESQCLEEKRVNLQQNEQEIAWKMRSLVHQTDGKIDFLFAGFQGIARAAKALDGPFVNFRGGMPLQLTTLETDEASKLIIDPLFNMGYRFESSALVEKIQYYTGNHPALIQFFCQELFQTMRAEHGKIDRIIQDIHLRKVFNERNFKRRIFDIVNMNLTVGADRSKRCLNIVLYFWVRHLFHRSENLSDQQLPIQSNRNYVIGETMTTEVLYQLIVDAYGKQRTENVIRYDEIDSYLSDLVVLGIAAQKSYGYTIANRYFAGLLSQNVDLDYAIRTTWTELEEYSATQKRRAINIPMQSGEKTLLPIKPDDEPRLLGDQKLDGHESKVKFVMGASAVGKSLLLNWLQQHVSGKPEYQGQAVAKVSRVNCRNLTSEGELRLNLCNSLQLSRKATWTDIQKSISREGFRHYICLEDVDGFPWPDWLEKTLDGKSNPISDLFRATNPSSKCQFIFTGGIGLTRFWVMWTSFLEEWVVPIPIKRFSRPDFNEWLRLNALIMSNHNLEEEVWCQTSGDPRTMRTLIKFLESKGRRQGGDFEVSVALWEDFRRYFFKTDEINEIKELDSSAGKFFVYASQWAKDFGAEVSETWLDLWLEENKEKAQSLGWTARRMLDEVTAWVLLDEIGTSPTINGTIGVLRSEDLWMQRMIMLHEKEIHE